MKTFKPFIIFSLFTLVTLSLSRIMLMIWKYERVLDADGVLWEVVGLPVDVVVDEAASDERDPVIEAALAALG